MRRIICYIKEIVGVVALFVGFRKLTAGHVGSCAAGESIFPVFSLKMGGV
jgi:hypothetical protein